MFADSTSAIASGQINSGSCFSINFISEERVVLDLSLEVFFQAEQVVVEFLALEPDLEALFQEVAPEVEYVLVVLGLEE